MIRQVLRGYLHVRSWWRQLRNRCVICNARIPESGDLRDVYYRRPFRAQCRWCNKRTMHALNYGMGARLQDLLGKGA
jgi:hypothetical protein